MTSSSASTVASLPPRQVSGERPSLRSQRHSVPAPSVSRLQQAVTALVIFGPLAGAVVAAIALFRKEASIPDLVIAAVMYAVTGHGLSAGYHRMCTHRAFRAKRIAKVALVLAGSLSFEGGVLSWASNHRCHHAYTDVEGDPHSPHLAGSSVYGQVRGALHAHVGWLFRPPADARRRWAPDLLADRDLVVLDRLFPLWCVVSLAIPALLGFAITGTGAGAFGGFLWGGLVRVFLLQQATFAVNSACHLWGKRPYRTRQGDQARNLAPLAVMAMGDNWHNLHHALPRLARHGVGRHEWDSTARLIAMMEGLSLVSDVHWPDPTALESRRRSPAGPEAVALT